MKQRTEKEEKEREGTRIKFLKAVKDGEYAKIEETSLPYSRMEFRTITVREEYFYSLR